MRVHRNLYYDAKTRSGEIPLIKLLLGSVCPLSPVMINYDRLSTSERCMVAGMLVSNHIYTECFKIILTRNKM